MNALTGFQIVASNGLQRGEGITPPNIAANLTAYQSFAPVNNYSNINVVASTLPFGLTSANANLLISLGANSFPHVFGQVPNDFSSNLGSGTLFTITPARTAAWFGNVSTANVYLQVLSQAQTYAATAQAVLGTASATQWAGGPALSATGGFSIIGGNDPAQFQLVANAISGLGSLALPTDPFNGFSNADCFNRILDSGNDTIGNLHLNFFGKTIVDPATGNTWIIGSELFEYVMANPVGMSTDDTFLITALNPLDAIIGEAANEALTQTGDLDAVVSFFSVSPSSASLIYQWTDALNIPLMLGQPTTIVSNALGLGTVMLDAYHLLRGLISNVSGYTNLPSFEALGYAMSQLSPLTNSPELLEMTSPVSQSQFSNLQSTFGPGSGTNGNPTVDDIMGSTNYNQALSNTIQGLKPLTTTTHYANISTDTANIRSALTSNIYPVMLSDGSVYTDVNSLAVGGSIVVNNSASQLANVAPSLTDTSLFTAYNGIAETHNNSVTLSAPGNFIPINTLPLITNALADYDQVSGFAGAVLSVIHRFYGASSSVKIDNPPQSAMFQKFPGGMSFSPSAILTSFPSSLASLASVASQIPNADEITGLNQVSNCFDSSTVTGQALAATVIEAQNAQVLQANGIVNQSLATNPVSLVTPPTGTNTIGGGLIRT